MTNARRDRLMAALLGPAHDEVGCDECFDLLDVYAERAANGDDAGAWMPAMAAHVEGCPACAEELDTMVALISDAAV